MKINNTNMPRVNPYTANEMKVGKTTNKPQFQADKIEISSEAKKLSEMQSYAAERNDRIEKIKAQIDAGTYKVNPEKLAVDLHEYYNK